MTKKIIWAALASVVALAACQPTLECGSRVFNGTPSGNSFLLANAFTFNPAACGQNCTRDQDAMIQMTWVYDETEQKNVYATDQPQSTRSDANGWSIDQLNNWAYAYYGLQPRYSDPRNTCSTSA